MGHEMTQDLTPYEFYSDKFMSKVSGVAMGPGRYLIGRAESCDITIDDSSVSSVHAVIEIKKDHIKIYDMNSTNGTFVDGKKILVAPISLQQQISFGNIGLHFRRYEQERSLPPRLEGLDPSKGVARTKGPLPPPATPQPKSSNANRTKVNFSKLDVDRILPQVSPAEKDKTPYIIYPLAADPKAEFSEYIFEDIEELRPIFRYELGEQAVEVMILFQDRVYEVDYIPHKNGVYKLVGASAGKKEIEFPYLRKNERVPIVEVKGRSITVFRPLDYEFLHLSDDSTRKMENPHDQIHLEPMDVVKFKKGELEIYLRNVSAPPQVKTMPFFTFDPRTAKYFLLFLILFFTPIAILAMMDISDDVQKEKAPERLATILYKRKIYVSKNKPIEKTKKAPKKVQKSPVKKAAPKPKPKPTPVTKKVVSKPAPKPQNKAKKPTPTIGQKVAKKVQNSKKRTAPKKSTVKRTVKGPKAATSGRKSVTKSKSTGRAAPRKANTPSPNKGVVEVYKNNRFKSTISNLMAKGGSLQGAKVSSGGSEAGSFKGTSGVSGGSVKGLKTANVASDVGNLTGATEGKLEAGRGGEGLVGSKSIYTAGIPSQTVVVGSIDPDTIRRILRAHLPQFRYCYQKSLDKSSRSNVQGVIKLAFTIGASGRVSKAGIDGGTSLPGGVTRCVVNVLRGIEFPSPRGGGRVDVRQPLNFYPQRI